jgi:hypothetical protein
MSNEAEVLEEMDAKEEDEILKAVRTRFARCIDHDSDQRKEAQDDLKFAFVKGHQWDDAAKTARGLRPCYEYNKVRQHIRQVTNDQRQNRPAIKIRAVEEGDKDTANTYQGLIRNIESVSNAERAYDTAFEVAVAGGYGGWRVVAQYADDDAFEQELRIKEVRNPFSLYLDPGAQEWDRRDALYGFVTEILSESEFKIRYPKAELSSFDGDAEWANQWFFDEKVRVCEYWYKKPYNKTICLLSNGETVDKEQVAPVLDELAAEKGVTILREREVQCMKVYQCVVSGAEVLSKPVEWPGKFIPIVPVWGDLVNIEGRDLFSGMVRFSKDAAKGYNFTRTMAVESVANAPKAPWLVTPKMLEGGLQKVWDEANVENFPYLPFNPDPNVPGGMPKREPPPDVPRSLIELAKLDNDDLKATMGQFDASLGKQGNETSGKAIMARQREGDNANFNYIDNLGRAIKYTGEILVDLIPHYYDTPRSIRVLGEDGAEKYVQLYGETLDKQTGQKVKVNDLSRGRYDVTVSVGPTFATQRMEAAELLTNIMQSAPETAPILADLVVKNMDGPGTDEASKRLRRMAIKAGMVAPTDEDREDEANNPTPPNPMAELELREKKLGADKIELENFKLAKEIQAPNETGPVENPALEAAKLDAEIRKAAIDAESKERIAAAQIQADLQKAEIDRQTKLEIAQIQAQHSALTKAAEIEAGAAKEHKNDQHASERHDSGRKTDAALTAAVTGLAELMRESQRPRRAVFERGPDGKPVGAVIGPAD